MKPNITHLTNSACARHHQSTKLKSDTYQFDNSMAENMPDDGRIGKEIDWSLVIPSITRPVWEPPALEVLDLLEDMKGFSFKLNDEIMKPEVPAPLRLRWLDLACKMTPLAVDMNWAEETLDAAGEFENQEKSAFYESLLEALVVDSKEVGRKYILWIRT